MSERKAVTKAIATRYRRANRAGKKQIQDELWPPPAGTATTPARR